MTALAEKVEALSGPCRETDAEIDRLLFPNVADGRAGNGVRMAPAYTASVDAVLALIAEKLPDWGGHMLFPGNPTANLGSPDGRFVTARGATLALALLAAFLRAMENDNG